MPGVLRGVPHAGYRLQRRPAPCPSVSTRSIPVTRCPTASDDCGRDLPDYRLTRPAAYRRRRRANVGEYRRAAVFGNARRPPRACLAPRGASRRRRRWATRHSDPLARHLGDRRAGPAAAAAPGAGEPRTDAVPRRPPQPHSHGNLQCDRAGNCAHVSRCCTRETPRELFGDVRAAPHTAPSCVQRRSESLC